MARRQLHHWDPLKIKLALRRFAQTHQRYPYWDELLQANHLPPRPTVIALCGSLAAAIRAAGGEPPPPRRCQRLGPRSRAYAA
jgi:hypothetical protein